VLVCEKQEKHNIPAEWWEQSENEISLLADKAWKKFLTFWKQFKGYYMYGMYDGYLYLLWVKQPKADKWTGHV